jgi:Flp pilus assembly protein TadG
MDVDRPHPQGVSTSGKSAELSVMIKGTKMMRRSKFVQRALELVGRFRDDQRGNVLIIVGAAIIPLVGALGLATDTSRGYLVKARLSQAIDAAALAGGKVIYNTDRDEHVLKYFKANFPTSDTSAGFDAVFDADFMSAEVTLETPVQATDEDGRATLSLEASATIPTTFMRVLGFDEVTVSASTEVTRDIIGLDAVISMDMSGSMEETPGGESKILAAQEAALNFLDAIYGTGDVDSPQIAVDGTTYDLIHIGFVPWNAKTRVTVENWSGAEKTTETPTGFDTNPITTLSQSTVYYGDDVAGRYSPVPLLMNPTALPGGWSGCVYARYLGDVDSSGNAINDNDADVYRGQQEVGGKDWYGWEPMAVYEAEPRTGTWGSSDSEPTSSRWRGAPRRCFLSYANDTNSSYRDNADGTIKGSTGSESRPRFSSSFPNTIVSPATSTGFRSPPVSGQYSGTLKFWADYASGNLLANSTYAQPNFGSGTTSQDTDCTRCLSRGIIPLTADKSDIYDEIDAITATDPDGNTNIQQGLYWAWEVLMPGIPFEEGIETVPFPRRRAIILMTDGNQVGGNGDAYKGRFGSGEPAGTVDLDVHGDVSVDIDRHLDPSAWDGNETAPNNLNNRLRWLAENVRNEGISLYVIALDVADEPDLKDLLRGIATVTPSGERYFYEADDPSQLNGIFEEIAASLTTVRVSS